MPASEEQSPAKPRLVVPATERITSITYRARRIMFVDFSHATPDEISATIDEATTVVRQSSEGSVLMLTDATQSAVDDRVIAKFKVWLRENAHYVVRSAVFGISPGMHRVIFSKVKLHSGRRNLRRFEDREKALEWLVSDAANADKAPDGPIGGGFSFWPGSETVRLQLQSHDDTVVFAERLSPADADLQARTPLALTRGTPLKLTIRTGQTSVGPLEAVVDSVEGNDPAAVQRFSVRFVHHGSHTAVGIWSVLLELREQGQLLSPPAKIATSETIDDPARILQLIKAMTAKHLPAYVGKPGGRRTRLIGAALDTERKHPLSWKGTLEHSNTPIAIDVSGYNSVYSFEVEPGPTANGLLSTSLPNRVTRVRHRKMRRARLPEHFTITFEHPVLPHTRIERHLLDISMGGLSLETAIATDLLYPSLVIPNVELRDDGMVVWSGKARVAYVTELSVRAVRGYGTDGRVGLVVETADDEDQRVWEELANVMLHPETSGGAGWGQSMWSVFEQSGYFNLSGKSPDEFVEKKRSQEDFNRVLWDAPLVGCQVVFATEEGDVGATLSISKIYQHTWIAHQLAKKRGGGPRHSVAMLFARAFEHAQRDPDARWYLAYTEAHVKFHQKVKLPFFRLAAQRDPNQAALLSFRLLENVGFNRPAQRPAGTEIGLCQPVEANTLMSVLSRTRQKPYREALDLVPERLLMRNTRKAFGNAGLNRERTILVARHEGEPMAAAVIEACDEAVNLFRIYDSARVFELRPGGNKFFAALHEEALLWFEQRHKDGYVFFCEDGTHEAWIEHGMRDLGAGEMCLLHTDLLPDLAEHILSHAMG